LLSVSGLATLDSGASLNIDLLNGFDPTNGTNFFIMAYGTKSGTFTITDPLFDNGLQQWVITSYDGGANGNEIVLTAESTAPVTTPEPASLLLLGTGLLGLAGYATKNRKARA
jgi:hypothetical protein